MVTPLSTLSSELKSCVKVEVATLGSPAQINSPNSLCERKATVNSNVILAYPFELLF